MSDSSPVPADQEVLITRIFEAPRERVFRAWVDPDHVAAWFGPGHMDTPREGVHIDLRVGGRYELTMVRRGGDGEFAIGYEILELVEPELIVLLEPQPTADSPSRPRPDPTGTRQICSPRRRETAGPSLDAWDVGRPG